MAILFVMMITIEIYNDAASIMPEAIDARGADGASQAS